LKQAPKEDLTKLVTALVKADEWLDANPDEGREVIRQIFIDRRQSPELADYWHQVKLFDHGQYNDEFVQFWIDFMVETGIIENGAVKPDDIYTNEYNPYYSK
jgi:ABC-type nitrate/sulfonate/bicarbonate transport system substrate-binding protein